MQSNEGPPSNIDVAEYVRYQNNATAAALMRIPPVGLSSQGQLTVQQSAAQLQPPRAHKSPQDGYQQQYSFSPSLAAASRPMYIDTRNLPVTSMQKFGEIPTPGAQSQHRNHQMTVSPLSDCVTLIGGKRAHI